MRVGYVRIRCQAPSVEHGGIREQHRAQSEGQGDIPEPHKTPSVEHRAICVRCGTQGLGAERSVSQRQGAKCQRTEQSVDRHGEPSVERGAICGRRGAGTVKHGAIREERPGRDAERQASWAEQSAGGAEFPKVLNHGAIRDAE